MRSCSRRTWDVTLMAAKPTAPHPRSGQAYGRAVTARVDTIPLSHPGLAAVGMLEQQGVEHREVSLPGGMHPVILRALGFRRPTVPALRWSDGTRVQGSRAIAAALHEHTPERELFPADPAARARVEEAERWGE